MATAVKKLVKKKWFEIAASSEFNNNVIGETLAVEPSEVVGRTITLTLGSITGEIKKQNINVTFKINDVKEKIANTELVKYELMPAQVRRLVKKSKNKAEDSFVCETKDKVKVRIKPMMFTRNNVQKGVLTDLRKAARNYFNEQAKELSYSQLLTNLLHDKLYYGMKTVLQKIHPSVFAEIRVVEKL